MPPPRRGTHFCDDDIWNVYTSEHFCSTCKHSLIHCEAERRRKWWMQWHLPPSSSASAMAAMAWSLSSMVTFLIACFSHFTIMSSVAATTLLYTFHFLCLHQSVESKNTRKRRFIWNIPAVYNEVWRSHLHWYRVIKMSLKVSHQVNKSLNKLVCVRVKPLQSKKE